MSSKVFYSRPKTCTYLFRQCNVYFKDFYTCCVLNQNIRLLTNFLLLYHLLEKLFLCGLYPMYAGGKGVSGIPGIGFFPEKISGNFGNKVLSQKKIPEKIPKFRKNSEIISGIARNCEDFCKKYPGIRDRTPPYLPPPIFLNDS